MIDFVHYEIVIYKSPTHFPTNKIINKYEKVLIPNFFLNILLDG